MKRVCVFCGSSPGADPAYLATASALGAELARRGLGLVYGGASVGLMGAGADGALRAGGEVLGVIRDLAHEHDLTMLLVTHEMRFARDVADRAIFMDGGVIVEQAPARELFTAPREERTRRFLRKMLEERD
jgi:uncharacterized protein (TIGR00730 family)